MHRANTLLDAFVGVFDNHNRAIHQHPHRKDQAKHHDVRNADSHEREERETQQERRRNCKPDQQRRPRTKCGQDHDHNECYSGQNRAFELLHHRIHLTRLVVRRACVDSGLKLWRPGGFGVLNGGFDQFNRVDQVEPFALYNLQR